MSYKPRLYLLSSEAAMALSHAMKCLRLFKTSNLSPDTNNAPPSITPPRSLCSLPLCVSERGFILHSDPKAFVWSNTHTHTLNITEELLNTGKRTRTAVGHQQMSFISSIMSQEKVTRRCGFPAKASDFGKMLQINQSNCPEARPEITLIKAQNRSFPPVGYGCELVPRHRRNLMDISCEYVNSQYIQKYRPSAFKRKLFKLRSSGFMNI